MSKALEIAHNEILDPANLGEFELQRVLGNLMDHRIDFADLYFESTCSESWVLEDSIVKDASHNIEQGVGVRAVSGERTGFAYSDEIVLPALTDAAGAARTIASHGNDISVQAWQRRNSPVRYTASDPLTSTGENDKVSLLKSIDARARAVDPRVTQVIASLTGRHSVILVAASDGAYCADVRPLVRLNVSVVVEENGKRESGQAGGGGRFGYEYFMQQDITEKYINQAVSQALVNLHADPAPAGAMTVILGPGWPGILLHEAIGHGLEADFNRKGTSAFSGRIGEKVASPLCTVVDDGTLQDRRGSLNIDDEGTPSSRTVLIEDGILKGYMQDKHNAHLMGAAATGNGRRQSYSHRPMPRMTNTCMLPGHHDREEIIASVDKGLYAVNFGGGQVDITNGKFVFTTSEAYLIEKGKVTRPVKGATLIGNGPDVLTRVSMVGNDLELDSGIGTCGKEGQSVPVGVGQPSLRIDELTVGGTGS